MMFLVHLLGLLYGFFGLIWTVCLTTPGDLVLPAELLGKVATLYPPDIFAPEWAEDEDNGDGTGTASPLNASKPMLISGGIFAYCAYYFYSKLRP